MSTLDASFYYVEHQDVPMHIGSLAVFDGPAPSYAELLALYAAKLPKVRRYRQVVRTTPLHVFRPFWTDDEHFDLRHHLRHAAVPAPGDREQLMTLAAQVIGQRLDPARPLWEAWFLEGIESGRWAIISKVHHCMVDGVGGSDLMAELFAPETSPVAAKTASPPPSPEAVLSAAERRWDPEPGPSVATMVAAGMLDAASWPLQQLWQFPGFVRLRLGTPAELLRFGRGLTGSARRLAARAASSLNGHIGPGRRWAWTTADLAEVKGISKALGVTVNDVILAATTSGFRQLLGSQGELEAGLVVRSLVPVSVRDGSDEQRVSNRISAVLVNLPVSEPDPGVRLRLLHDQMSDLKSTKQAVGTEILAELLGFTAPALLALGSRAAFRIPQPLVQAITTNVPGPRFPLFILGRQMVAAYPYVPIADSLRIGIAIFSYLDSFSFGITGDYRAVTGSDLDILISGIRRGLSELADSAVSAQRGDPSDRR